MGMAKRSVTKGVIPPTRFMPGDIITTSNKGVFRVTKIERRYYTKGDVQEWDLRYADPGEKAPVFGGEYNPLVHYVQIARTDGTPVNTTREQCCDAAYCQPAIAVLEEQVAMLQASIARLKALSRQRRAA